MSSMTGEDSYSKTNAQLSYLEGSLGSQLETSPTIDKTTFTFDVILALTSTSSPRIYTLINSSYKEISCKKDTKNQAKLICTPTNTEMPETKSYENYYSDSCNEKKQNPIIVNHVLTDTIKVTDISLSGGALCIDTPFSEIIITTSTVPKGKVSKVILTSNNINYTFVSCSYNETTTITCASPDPATVAGSYSLTAIEGVDTFIITAVLSKRLKIEMTFDILDPSKQSNQTVNEDNKEFKVLLESADVIPSIYVGNTITKNKKVNCEIKGIELTCSPSSTNMPISLTYEI